MENDYRTDRIRSGLRLPLEDRQDRWDRIQAWRRGGLTLTEIVDAEAQLTGGPPLTRERVRAILKNPRPGTVGRPRLPGLRSRAAQLEQRLHYWKGRSDEHAKRQQASIRSKLREVNRAISFEERRLAGG